MQFIADRGEGVLVLLRGEEDERHLVQRIRDYQMQDRGINLPKPDPNPDLRSYGVGAQILMDLGVRRMRVLGTPKRLHGLSGFGLEIVEYVENLSTDQKGTDV